MCCQLGSSRMTLGRASQILSDPQRCRIPARQSYLTVPYYSASVLTYSLCSVCRMPATSCPLGHLVPHFPAPHRIYLHPIHRNSTLAMAATRVARNALTASLRRNAISRKFPSTFTRSLASPAVSGLNITKSTTLKNGLTVPPNRSPSIEPLSDRAARLRLSTPPTRRRRPSVSSLMPVAERRLRPPTVPRISWSTSPSRYNSAHGSSPLYETDGLLGHQEPDPEPT